MGPQLVLQESFLPDGPVRRFRAVVLTGNENGKEADSAGGFVAGFCQDEITAEDAEDGRRGAVRIMGISRAVSGAALTTPQQAVTVDNQGRVVPATVGSYIVGRVATLVDQADDWTAVFLTHEGVMA